MAGRRKRVEHDNHERWLISYADFVTLLFAFFVVMYSISSVNEGKYKTFSDSLSAAFAQQPADASLSTIAASGVADQLVTVSVDRRTAHLVDQQKKIREQMKQVEKNLNVALEPLIHQGLVGIRTTGRGVVVDISASTLFKEGDVSLQPGAQDTLKQLAQVLSQGNQSAEVEGHTDDVPIKTAQFPSNWELSSGRASSVVRMLAGYGVPEKRLAAVGMAANRPVVPNDTPENRARNRRVSVTVLSPEFDRSKEDNDVLNLTEGEPAGSAGKVPVGESANSVVNMPVNEPAGTVGKKP